MELEKILDTPLMTSKFAKIFIRGEDIQLMHSILMDPVYLDSESLQFFESFKQGKKIRGILEKAPESRNFIQELINHRLLVKKGVNEIDKIRTFVEKSNSEDLTIMYLLPTDQCNLRCKYCFLENSMTETYKHSFMNQDTMKKGIDFFAQKPLKQEGRKVLILYGGEPLLNSLIVKEAVIYSKDNYPQIGINLVTNGTLITKELAKLFSERDVFVGVSLDGPREITDKIRVYPNGKGVFNSAIKGYEKLKQAQCKHLGFSLTIASHNVNNLREHVEYLVRQFEPNAFGFNFLVDTHFGSNPYSVPIELATEKAIEAFKYLREKGIFEERMMRKIKPFIKGTIHLKDCGAIGNQMVLSPDGDVGPCQAFLPSRKYFNQNITKGEINLEEKSSFGQFKDRYPMNMKECLDCEAIGICGGGCPYQSYLKTGSIWGLDQRMCIHNKKFLNWLLWDLYDSKNGNTTS